MDTKGQTTGNPSAIGLRLEHPVQELFTILMRGKWLIVAIFLAVFFGTLLYTFFSKPVYKANAMILLDPKAAAQALPIVDNTGSPTSTRINNELQILWARSTASAVAQALLDQTYLDTGRTTFIPIIRAEVDGTLQDVKDTLGAVTDRVLMAVDFAGIKESDIILITARSNNPEEAALLANTYTKVYADQSMTASRTKSRAIREFLQSQMESKHANLDSTEHQLQAYMRSSGVVSLDAEASKVVDQLAQLQATRDGIEVDITSHVRTLSSYKQELATQEPNVAKAMGESNDTYIRLLQEQLAKLEVQRDVVIAQNPDLSGDKIYSDKLSEINSQIASLKKTLKVRTETFLGTLIPGDRISRTEGGTTGFLSEVKKKIIEQQIELDGLLARKEALNRVLLEYEKQFNQIPQKSIALAKLQRARLSNEKLYLLVEEKFNEAAIAESSEFGPVNIKDLAVVPKDPVSPKVATNLLLGAVLGLFLGGAVVLVRAKMDDRIHTPEDLKKYGITSLTAIGIVNGQQHTNGKSGLDHRLVTFLNPLSSVSEGYRQLRQNVQYTRPDCPVPAILVTSPSPEEGKSTTVSNLAISFAQGENRVLLVDADLRKPIVHSLFCLEKEPGLTNVIFRKSAFGDAVHHNVIPNLDILCCGATPPNPAEVVGSRRMREFIDHVRGSYDVLLFDSPPLLAVTDAAMLSRVVDTVLLVVSSGQTSLGSVERATEIIQGAGTNLSAIVLNHFDFQKAYGGYYGHRRNYYAYGYGYTGSDNGDSGKSKTNGSKRADIRTAR